MGRVRWDCLLRGAFACAGIAVGGPVLHEGIRWDRREPGRFDFGYRDG
jgi:hypothetical protein